MKRTYIASPLRAPEGDHQTAALHVAYAKCAMLHAMVEHRESPYLSHLLLTQVLRDSVPAQRALGMKAGKAMMLGLERFAAYIDLGWSSGMYDEKMLAVDIGLAVESRLMFSGRPSMEEILAMIDALEARIVYSL